SSRLWSHAPPNPGPRRGNAVRRDARGLSSFKTGRRPGGGRCAALLATLECPNSFSSSIASLSGRLLLRPHVAATRLVPLRAIRPDGCRQAWGLAEQRQQSLLFSLGRWWYIYAGSLDGPSGTRVPVAGS